MNYQNSSWGTALAFFGISVFSTSIIWSQSNQQIQEIVKGYDSIKLVELIHTFKKDLENTKQKIALKKQASILFDNQKQLDGTVVSLNDFGTDDTPLYYTTHQDPTSKVSRADALYSDGLLDLAITGKGMTVGVWDAGVARTTHQEFDTRVKNRDGGAVDNHGTLVTGTVVSAGVKKKAKGVAFSAEAHSYDWSRDKIEVAEAAANGLLLSNHSYGIKTDRVPDWYFGAYIKVSQDWDNIMYNAPYYLMVTAAGNAHNSQDNESPNFGKTQDGFDLLLGFTTAKNGLVIAGATTEIDNTGNLKTADVSSYSSFGPTDDGRIKPDLAGDGTLIYSTNSNNDSSYSFTMGTSMAAPGVTGALLLLQEYYQELNGNFMKSSTLKGLALHTADDVQQPGPDYKMGWGVINTKKAAETIKKKDFSTLILEEVLENEHTFSFTVKSNGQEPLSASISWTDPSGNNINQGALNAPVAALTNDLDIRITKDGQTFFPWKLNPSKASSHAEKGDNLVDNFERIDIANADGEYTVTITHKGGLTNDTQNFSIVVSGVQLTECTLEAPQEMKLGVNEESEMNLNWASKGEEALYEFQIRSASDEDWRTHTLFETEFSLALLEMGSYYTARVRSVCSQNLASEFSEEIHFEYQGADTQLESNEVLTLDDRFSITLYPNPVVNELQVAADLSKDAMYSVVSTNGAVLKKGKLNNNINVEDLSAGLYVLNIQDYAGMASTKFVKN